VRVYTRRQGWEAIDLRELWSYRDLLYFLTLRDVLIRYKQAVIGVAWAVLQPFLTMVVFTVVFNRFLGVKSPDQNLPYAVFSFSGLIAWNFFSGSVSRAGGSLVGNANLISKVYFPRLIIPTSAVLGGFLDFLVSFVFLFILMGAYGIAPHWQAVFLPLFIILMIAASLSLSLWLSALNVLYRDVQYIIPFFLQLLMFLSPVIYSLDKVPHAIRTVVAINPMTGVIGGFRWALLGQPFPGRYLWISIAVTAVLFSVGLFYFKRIERSFADVV
jgi:lipopolysaccharide transport system permease protein